MAVVAKVKRKDDKNFSRLKEIYNKETLEVKKEEVSLTDIDIKKLVKEKRFTRKELLIDAAIMLGVALFAFSGYLLSKAV